MRNPKTKRPVPLRWLWILLIQAVSMLALGVLISLSIVSGKFLHGLCLWLLAPLAGFGSACAATRKGLLNYAAWILPPAMETLANLLLWGYSPSVGPVMLCAFISFVGAATGEVLKSIPKHKGVRRWKKI